MIRQILIASALVLLAPALALAGPDLQSGDRFTYQSKSKTYSQTYEGPGHDGGYVFRTDNGDRLAFDASLSLTGMPGSRITPNNGQLQLDPERGFEVGKSWAVTYEVTRDSGTLLEKTRSCSVTAHEPALIVRAGMFDAYRVDCTIVGGTGGAVYGESWYDARTWRALKHSVGDPAGNLKIVLELIEIDLQPR